MNIVGKRLAQCPWVCICLFWNCDCVYNDCLCDAIFCFACTAGCEHEWCIAPCPYICNVFVDSVDGWYLWRFCSLYGCVQAHVNPTDTWVCIFMIMYNDYVWAMAGGLQEYLLILAGPDLGVRLWEMGPVWRHETVCESVQWVKEGAEVCVCGFPNLQHGSMRILNFGLEVRLLLSWSGPASPLEFE